LGLISHIHGGINIGKFLSYPIPKAIVEEWEKVK